ncbi:MAG TPA: hypothetical protein VIL44_01510 [Micromonospora sp.]|nr:MAG: hypothetical protein DIU79_10250 [Actinomycetota bacterium]
MAEPERRRRRSRSAAAGRAAGAGPGAAPGGSPAPATRASNAATTVTGASEDDHESERSLRSIVGPGASQVSVTAAMRARDASRPTDEDLAEAEKRLVIVRRFWVPRDELPRSIIRPS